MTHEETAVKNKFRQLLNHLGSPEGVNAVGIHLPNFIAAIMVCSNDVEGGLEALCDDVRNKLADFSAFESATRQ